MPSSKLYFDDRKTSDKITAFLIIVIIVSIIVGLLFPRLNNSTKKDIPTTQEADSSLQRG